MDTGRTNGVIESFMRSALSTCICLVFFGCFDVPDLPQFSADDVGNSLDLDAQPDDVSVSDVGGDLTDSLPADGAELDQGMVLDMSTVIRDAVTPVDAFVQPDPRCDDGVQNGEETDVDCGGEGCPRCSEGSRCAVSSDCESSVCRDDHCAAPTCGDGVVNGTEDCDDGNQIDDDDCTNACLTPTCGNGVVDPGEGSCDCPEGQVNLDRAAENGCECVRRFSTDQTCDGVDDDCDGRVDEAFSPVDQDFGACIGFEDECALEGTLQFNRVACVDGMPTPRMITRPCRRDTDGQLVAQGEWSACQDFTDECDETGRQTRLSQVCAGGSAEEVEELLDCQRDTDGFLVAEEAQECLYSDDPCVAAGRQQSRRVVCRDGGPVETAEVGELGSCMRITDGLVQSGPVVGECGGFQGLCGLRGVRPVTRTVCRNDAAVEEVDMQECERLVGPEQACPLRAGGDGVCLRGFCRVVDSVLAMTGGSQAMSARLSVTCQSTGASCVSEGVFEIEPGRMQPNIGGGLCYVSCPATSSVSICCSNGSAGCGGNAVEANANWQVEGVFLSGFVQNGCQVGANGEVRCIAQLDADPESASIVRCEFTN